MAAAQRAAATNGPGPDRAVAHVAAGSRPGSGPGPEMAAAQSAAATDGRGPDPGPDPAATCATARWPLPVYFIFSKANVFH